MNLDDLLKLLQQFEGLKDALFGIPIVVVVWALTQGAKRQFSLTGKTVEPEELIKKVKAVKAGEIRDIAKSVKNVPI